MLECDGHTHSLRWPGPPMTTAQLEVRPFRFLHASGLPGNWPGRVLGRSHAPVVQMEKPRPPSVREWVIQDSFHGPLPGPGSGLRSLRLGVRAAMGPEARTVLATADSGLSGLAWRLPQ